ncbi:MAG: hypothetical protein ACTSWY_00530 [Promethearchaeota archaeon]
MTSVKEILNLVETDLCNLKLKDLKNFKYNRTNPIEELEKQKTDKENVI